MAIVFGPVASRRFGSSLGIDLSPAQKCCNYDCLYCELAKAKVMDQSINPPSISEVMNELKAAIARFGATDVITLTDTLSIFKRANHANKRHKKQPKKPDFKQWFSCFLP